jgi:hypothetical protein
MALTKVSVSMIDAVNTASATTFLSGAGTWAKVFNQDLNTTDNVRFASVTTPVISGVDAQPVVFPTGIDFGSI